MELGSVWNRLGSKVTVLEFLDRILPGTDSELAAEAFKLFQKQGIEFRLGSRVTSAKFDKRATCASSSAPAPNRSSATACWSPSAASPPRKISAWNPSASSSTPKAAFPSTIISLKLVRAKNIYAIGDCIHGPMLAHKAEEDGVACVEGIVTGYAHVDYNLVPSVIFTHPEIAAVGKTEDQLTADGTPFRKGIVPLPRQRPRPHARLTSKAK